MLNIIEPTLNSYAGHCYSLVESITQAVPVGRQIRVWAGTESGKFWQGKGQINPYFFHATRKIQSYFLYRHLLRKPGKLLLSTAASADFMMLDWAAPGKIPLNKVYLYVHWLGAKAAKAEKLARLAQKQPHLKVMCTTVSTADFFNSVGFCASMVPYPRAIEVAKSQGSQAFDHLLFAGAARMDKGFDHMADLVENLARTQAQWPIWIQASTTHQARHDDEILLQIERIKHSGYSSLTLIKNTLTPQQYLALFSGGISIQPYAKADFEDRVSGVTLDALAQGCPVVVTANTWLGRVVLKHNAGVATSDLSASGLRQAIAQILHDYEGYSQRASNAGQALQQEHSALLMMDVIFPK